MPRLTQPTPADTRNIIRDIRSDKAAAAFVAEQLRRTGDPGMLDEADALVIAVREWNADSAEEYGVETRRDLILVSLDTLAAFDSGE